MKRIFLIILTIIGLYHLYMAYDSFKMEQVKKYADKINKNQKD